MTKCKVLHCPFVRLVVDVLSHGRLKNESSQSSQQTSNSFPSLLMQFSRLRSLLPQAKDLVIQGVDMNVISAFITRVSPVL